MIDLLIDRAQMRQLVHQGFKAVTPRMTADLSAGPRAVTAMAEAIRSRIIQNVTGSALDDTITGDSNDNVLDGGAGNNTPYGNNGADTLLKAVAFAGTNIIEDFNTSDCDKIDIINIPEGHYNPATVAIAHFMQPTTNGPTLYKPLPRQLERSRNVHKPKIALTDLLRHRHESGGPQAVMALMLPFGYTFSS